MDDRMTQMSADKMSRVEWTHLYAWLGGVLVLLAHFVRDWPLLPGLLPWGLSDMHPWRGHVLIEARTVTGLVLLGGLIGSCWWWAVARGRGIAGVFASILVLLLGVAAMAGWISRSLLYIAEAAWLVSGLFFTFIHRQPIEESFGAFLRSGRGFNAVFVIIFIAVNTAGDAVLLVNAPPGWISRIDFVFSRLLTHTILACAVWLLLALHDRWMPRMMHWLARALLALMPLFMIADIGMHLLWSKGLFKLFAELEVGGQFQWWRALEAGGVEFTPGILASGALAVVMAFVLYGASAWGSRRAGWRVSPRALIVTACFAWVLLQLEQGAGLFLKSRAWGWWERKACDLRFTPFEPKPGWASFDVEFVDDRPEVSARPMDEKPEIFLFLVETLRADAIRPDVAPFLSRWRETECQQLGETFAASNITQLSWFSIMSGRLPMNWEDGRSRGQLALLPSALKASGYQVDARMVADFTYMDIVRTNFGEPLQADHVEWVSLLHPDHKLQKPDREIQMMKRVRDAVTSRTPDGSAWIMALDSPHYPYSWAASFKAPFAGYEENPIFPVSPSTEQIERVKRRYWNSVAWVDSLMAEFVNWLKSTSRYDNAIIILTGDHGEEFREHGSWFHGSALNAEQTRAPILIKWPAAWGRGPAKKQASHLDITPTLLSAIHCPDEWWRKLPGRSLLGDDNCTSVTNTTYASQNGECMCWHRDGWTAAFGWPRWSESGAPRMMWLERLEGPDGPLPGRSPQEYESILREHFPDVFGRVLKLSARR